VGPNGAGKSTLLKLVAGLLRPEHGSVKLDGHDLTGRPTEAARWIGLMPDPLGVYTDISCREYLQFFAKVHRLEGAKLAAQLETAVDVLGLGPWMDAEVESLSAGWQRRLALGRMLLLEAPLLLLDEPAAGLDVRARAELLEIVRGLSGLGRTVVISSHILPELEELADRFGIMDQGRWVEVAPGRTFFDRRELKEGLGGCRWRIRSARIPRRRRRRWRPPGRRRFRSRAGVDFAARRTRPRRPACARWCRRGCRWWISAAWTRAWAMWCCGCWKEARGDECAVLAGFAGAGARAAAVDHRGLFPGDAAVDHAAGDDGGVEQQDSVDPGNVGLLVAMCSIYIQAGLLVMLSPLAAAQRISQEREQRTYAALVNSPLGPGAIARGKLLGAWAFTLWLGVLTLPFTAVAALWGGLAAWVPLACFGLNLLAGLTLASLALGLSGLFGRSLSAYLASGAVLFLWAWRCRWSGG
jgi:ABC-type Na+ transport system ATPase subunit NatA